MLREEVLRDAPCVALQSFEALGEQASKVQGGEEAGSQVGRRQEIDAAAVDRHSLVRGDGEEVVRAALLVDGGGLLPVDPTVIVMVGRSDEGRPGAIPP